MHDPANGLDPTHPDLPPPRGRPLLAWLVILLAVGYVLYREQRPAPADEKQPPADKATASFVLEFQARYLVGAGQLLGEKEKLHLYEQMSSLNTGSFGQRLRFVILAGEMAGPDEALRKLEELNRQLAESKVELTADQAALKKDLTRLYTAYQVNRWWRRVEDMLPAFVRPLTERLERPLLARALPDAERQRVRSELGWFGDLALAPPRGPDEQARAAVLAPATRTVGVLVSFSVLLLVAGLAGLIGLLVFLALVAAGKVRSRLRTGSPGGGVYAETFAVWMLLFLGLNWLAAHLAPPGAGLLPNGVASLCSLSALAWPVCRGLPWQQVRRDIGWTLGDNPTLEPLIGAACYPTALPLVAVGFVLVFALMALESRLHSGGGSGNVFAPNDLPAHPIIQFLVASSYWGRLQILVLGTVIAPVVEETMFRGVLYRHLREASRGWRIGLSVLFSATVVSFVFAVIHPQGLVAVPLLMALAYAFSAVREWRGTLIPGMVAHGITNGVTMTLLLQLAGGS
jgi:membrane protease YdiL (CAAX protease family)